MAYIPLTWVQNVTPGNSTNMNHLEGQYGEAVNSFNPDVFTPYVLSGLVATKDGTTANQLDVTAGVTYPIQSDGTTRRRSYAASTPGQFVTATPSTTYYLFANADGTWTWGTTSAGPANSLGVCQVTT